MMIELTPAEIVRMVLALNCHRGDMVVGWEREDRGDKRPDLLKKYKDAENEAAALHNKLINAVKGAEV